MALTTEKKDSLRALYAVWGLDTVRREIERNGHNGLTPPDVIAFARSWIATEEAKGQRMIQNVKVAGMVVLSVIGGTIVGLLVF